MIIQEAKRMVVLYNDGWMDDIVHLPLPYILYISALCNVHLFIMHMYREQFPSSSEQGGSTETTGRQSKTNTS